MVWDVPQLSISLEEEHSTAVALACQGYTRRIAQLDKKGWGSQGGLNSIRVIDTRALHNAQAKDIQVLAICNEASKSRHQVLEDWTCTKHWLPHQAILKEVLMGRCSWPDFGRSAGNCRTCSASPCSSRTT